MATNHNLLGCSNLFGFWLFSLFCPLLKGRGVFHALAEVAPYILALELSTIFKRSSTSIFPLLSQDRFQVEGDNSTLLE